MNFNSLMVGDSLYILHKTNEGPVLTVAEITEKSAPRYEMQNQSVAIASDMQQVLDFNVRIGDRTEPMRGLVASSAFTTYNMGKQYVAADKETVMRELDRMMSTSRAELDRTGYNNSVIEKGEDIFEQLNPKYKEEKEQRREIANLKGQMTEVYEKMDKMMDKMMGMMSDMQEVLRSKSK